MEIPEDVQEKLLRFARAGIAVAVKGNLSLSIGSAIHWALQALAPILISSKVFGHAIVCGCQREMFRRVSWAFMTMKEFARAMA